MRYLSTAVAALIALALAVVAAVVLPRLVSTTPRHAPHRVSQVQGDPHGPVTPASAQFSYGFDFAQEGPYADSKDSAPAVTSARDVLSDIPGLLEDVPIMDWGLPNPEPSPGIFNLQALAARINLITSTGGTPVITLCAAPRWMTAANGPEAAPTPVHYQDFARLAAKIAQSFPQVKYFVVWNEFKGFWNPAAKQWEIQMYTDMYNDVYSAIKNVRPDALVGGPYAPIAPYAVPQPGTLPSTPHGAWGYLDQRVLNAVSYWLTYNVGADFIAVDGPDFPMSGPITSPLAATGKYAAVDQWLRERTSLPIWWMESPIQPPHSGWSADQAAAIRIATLVQLASSGARAGLQWQPQQGAGMPDEGLWTATSAAQGGQPTVLARLLPRVLAVLRYPTTVVSGQRPGIFVASSRGGTIAINTTTARVSVRVKGTAAALRPGEVSVALSPAREGVG
jgi:hypothetical protein